MGGNWLGLVELCLVLFTVLGWAIYELYALRAKPPAGSGAGATDTAMKDEQGAPAQDEAPPSAPPPRHPERQ